MESVAVAAVVADIAVAGTAAALPAGMGCWRPCRGGRTPTEQQADAPLYSNPSEVLLYAIVQSASSLVNGAMLVSRNQRLQTDATLLLIECPAKMRRRIRNNYDRGCRLPRI